MPTYRIWPTGEKIELESLKGKGGIPYPGAKVIIKEKPSIAREVSTD